MRLKLKSKYAITFNDQCAYWSRDVECNKLFLRHQELYFNDVLRSRGYVFLREIYEALGYPITKNSITVGWFYDDRYPAGDNCIKFRTDYHNTYIDIDFNVDGDILYHF